MSDNDLYPLFERLKNDLIHELKPPWWEPWLLFGSFIFGIAVGAVVGKLFL